MRCLLLARHACLPPLAELSVTLNSVLYSVSHPLGRTQQACQGVFLHFFISVKSAASCVGVLVQVNVIAAACGSEGNFDSRRATHRATLGNYTY